MNKKLIIGAGIGVVAAAAVAVAVVLISNSAVGGTLEERKIAAETLVEEGKLTKAANTYESVLKDDSGNKDASLALADVYAEKRKYEDAVDVLKNAIRFSPTDVELYDRLMKVYQNWGETGEALEFIEGIEDTELRRKYLNAAYDRTSENYLSTGNTMGNLSSGGMLAFKDDTIFYCDVSKGNSLYKYENGKTTLLSDGNISSLNVVGEYIYFVDKARDYSIFKMKADGSDYSRVKEIMATNLIVLGNKMYFINWNDECRVYSLNTDGSKLTKITEKSTEILYAYGSKLYVNDRDNIDFVYQINLDGANESMIVNDSVYFVSCYDDNIYFRSDNDALNVYRMTKDGSVYEPLNNSRSGYINADGDKVYFVDFANNGSIVRMNEDGSGQTVLCSDGATNLSEDGEWLYYFSDYNDKKLYRIRKDGSGRECLN